MVEDWKIPAGFVAQREARENKENSTLEMHKASALTSSNNEKQTRIESTLSKPKRVRFSINEQPGI